MTREHWNADQCAQEWGGITASTWRAYVAQGRAPEPLPGWDDNRRRRWDAEQVRAAKLNRPGQGRRTDLSSPPSESETHDEH